MKRTKKKPKPASIDAWAWLTKTHAAAAAGYSVRNFTERLQPRVELEKKATTGKGASKRFDVRAVVRAAVAYVVEQNQPAPDADNPFAESMRGDPKLLDKLRIESTEKIALANKATRRELVDRAALINAMSGGFIAASGLGKKLVNKYGNEAGEIWNEAIEAMQDTVLAALGESEDES